MKVSRGRTPSGPDRGESWHGFAGEHGLTRSVRDSAALLVEWTSQLAGRRVSSADCEMTTDTLGLLGRAVPASDYVLAVERLQFVARSVAAFFEQHPVLLTPTLAQPPIEIGALQPLSSERAAMRSFNALGAGWLLRLLRVTRAMAAKNFRSARASAPVGRSAPARARRERTARARHE